MSSLNSHINVLAGDNNSLIDLINDCEMDKVPASVGMFP